MKVATRSVKKWINRESVKNSSGQGRPPKTTKEKKKLIIKQISKKPFTGTDAMIEEIRSIFDVDISARTLRRWINEMGGKWRYPPSYHKISTYQQRNRLEWCNRYLNYNWRDGVWLHDESFFALDQSVRKQRVFNDQPPVPKRRFFIHLNFEAFISYDGKTKLYFYKGTRTSESFRQVLDSQYIADLQERKKKQKNSKIIVFFDKARAHTAKETQNFLKKKRLNFKFFCTKPVEINMIEWCWGYIKKKTREKNPKSLNEAKKWLIYFWNTITRATLRNLFIKIPNRIKEVIDVGGKKTKYWNK